MDRTTSPNSEMGTVGRIVGIFMSPRETFESIDRNPTWLVPFVLVVLFAVGMQLLVLDIGLRDQILQMEARGVPETQIALIKERMSGALRYVNLIAIPPVTLALWAILAGILLFGTNTLLGGNATFKKFFAMQAWTSLIGLLAGVIKTGLILSKKTTIGVTTSLAVLLPDPEIGKSPGLVYRLLSKCDLFTIWGLVLWAIGISVLGKVDFKKSAGFIAGVWAIWILLSVGLGSLLGSRFGG